MGFAIATRIDIAASPERVWSILTDFESYPAWNPFVVKAEGEARLGGRLRIEVTVPGRARTVFRPTITAWEPQRRLVWSGSLPLLFKGDHAYAITPAAGGVTFEHGETFHGLLVPLLADTLRGAERSYRAMNEALKARAEAG